MEQRRLRLVELASRAGELLLAKGDAETARRMGEAALATDPWSERAHRVVVAASDDMGDDPGTQRARERYRDALVDVGLEPTEARRRMEQLNRRFP